MQSGSFAALKGCIDLGIIRLGAANNHFGIKAPLHHGRHSTGAIAIGYVMANTAEYDKDHNKYYVEQPFRAYNSMTDSFEDHGIWVRDNHRYGDMLARFLENGDADAVAHALECGAYAGAYNTVYADHLISHDEKARLLQI